MSELEGSISSNSPYLDEDEREVTLGTTAVEIVGENPNRVFCVIQNRSDTAVFISTKRTVSTATGLRLIPETGSVEYRTRDHGSLAKRAHFGITSAAGKVVVVQEAFVKKRSA